MRQLPEVVVLLDCKKFGYAQVIGGDPTNNKCTSIGGSMRRYHAGVELQTPDGLQKFKGGIYGSKADNPQHSNFLSTMETATATAPCKQCLVLLKEYLRLNLDKSYIDTDDPPVIQRTSEVYKQQVKVIGESTNATRRKLLAQQQGYSLTDDETKVTFHYATHLPGGDDMVMDNVGVDVAHDELLGSWPLQCYLQMFFMVRDKENPNFLGKDGLLLLNGRWVGYGWKGSLRSHVPHPFRDFKGRGPNIGKKLYKSDYRKGMPVPKQSDPFKWTIAMSFVVLVHIVAVLSPLIKDHQCPIWRNLLLHQRCLMGLLKWSASTKEIYAIDGLIRQHQKGGPASCMSKHWVMFVVCRVEANS